MAGVQPNYRQTGELRSIEEIPMCFRSLFGFRYFNVVQSDAFDLAFAEGCNMVHIGEASTCYKWMTMSRVA